MIRFGIAGIPLTSKGRTFVDSVEDVHFLGLNSLEVQLLRVNLEQIPATDYAGLTPRDVDASIIVNVLRPDDEGNYVSVGTDTVIEEEDILQELFWNMAINYNDIMEGGQLAKELDIELSIHAPYYMDLLANSEVSLRSYSHLKWAMIIGRGMNAKRVITHTGFYHGDKRKSLTKAVDVYSSIANELPVEKKYPILGVETSGKQEIFGSVEDVLGVAKKVPQIEPIINFPHIHSVSGGSLLEVRNFEEIIEKFRKYSRDELYIEFAGVEYENRNELKLTPIKHGDLKFETFSEYLVDEPYDYNIISCSPLLEHDAQYMNLIFLRSLSRKLQRKETTKKKGKEVETVTREYPVKKGIKISAELISDIAKEVFGNAKVNDSHVISKTPGLDKIEAFTDGKKFYVTTETSKDAKEYENAIKLFNVFLEKVTGYSSKDRKKKMSKT